MASRDKVSYLAWCTAVYLMVMPSVRLWAQTESPPPPTAPEEKALNVAPVGAAQVLHRRTEGLGFGIMEGGTKQLAPYKGLRYEEDYSYLKDRSRRTDFWDLIKYIPLGGREDTYLSIGGEVRARYEFFHNENAGSAPADGHGNNDWAIQRYMLHGDLHVGKKFRFFGQIWSGLEYGRIGGPRPDIDEDRFDVHQAFADIVLPLGKTDSLTLRLGRQEMTYGDRRLIDVREAPNLRRSFDAARFLLRIGEWSVDGFLSKPVRNRLHVFDNDPDPDRSLWGLYAVHPLALLPDGHTDLYYLGYENKQGRFDQGTAYELRHSLGTRIWGSPLPWEYNFEFIWQFGTFGSGTIQAWAAASATYYHFDNLPFRPRLGLIADITSGDRDPKSANLQTFNPLFPTGAYFNLQDPAGPQNFMHLQPALDLYVTERVTTSASWGFFWRQSPDDGVYLISGAPFRTAGESRKLYVGNAPELKMTWRVTRHITLLAAYVHFFSGPFLNERPPGKDIDYFTAWMTYMY